MLANPNLEPREAASKPAPKRLSPLSLTTSYAISRLALPVSFKQHSGSMPKGSEMASWWYYDRHEEIGPVSDDEIRHLLLGGQIHAKTLVWDTSGEPRRPLNEVKEFQAAVALVESRNAFPLATRWPRFFARVLDTWWEVVLFAFGLGYALSWFSADFVAWLSRPSSDMFFSLFVFPLALTADALVYWQFGNTPGKALVGLKVLNKHGGALTFKDYLNRNFSLWVSGIGLGIPIANLAAMLYQANRLQQGTPASYDRNTGHQVVARHIGFARKAVVAVVFLASTAGIVTLNDMGQEKNRKVQLASRSPAYAWENPTTRGRSQIEAVWKYSARQLANGTTSHVFNEVTEHAEVTFAQEHAEGMSLQDYVKNLKQSLGENISLVDEGAFLPQTGLPVWRGIGAIPGHKDLRVTIQVVQDGSNFWRSFVVQSIPFAFSDPSVERLNASLLSTLK